MNDSHFEWISSRGPATTTIWERRYLGAEARADQSWARAPLLPRHDAYFVTDHKEVPWHDDGLREGDLEIRAAITDWFVDALTERGESWVLLTGSLDERVDVARRTIDQVLQVRQRLAGPVSGPGFDHSAG
jgi:HTH-type transcriptional repressor of NAD biosynthesis genes